ncbi:unnamed protein product, partial [Dracunculus medinensis]|uniref:Zinc finger protein n=1 Tax=Dracunculus medinensis TaxID=318479 RepID=A0A0N4U5S4_DRAME
QRICPTESSEHWNAEIGPTKRKKEIVQCEYCLTVLKHPSKIDAHMRTHTGEKPFQCHICHRKFTQRTPLRMHVRRHNNELPFECSWGCGKRFVSNAVKNAHELTNCRTFPRRSIDIYKTKIIFFLPSKSIYISGHYIHLKSLDSITPGFNWSSSLSMPSIKEYRKYKEVNREVKKYRGQFLGMPLSERKSRGKGSVTIECHLCGLILKYPSKIKAHMRTHSGERPFLCDHCGMQCSTRNSLRVHIRRAHTDERPYECTWECGKNFVTIAARNEHERIVHSGIKRY